MKKVIHVIGFSDFIEISQEQIYIKQNHWPNDTSLPYEGSGVMQLLKQLVEMNWLSNHFIKLSSAVGVEIRRFAHQTGQQSVVRRCELDISRAVWRQIDDSTSRQ